MFAVQGLSRQAPDAYYFSPAYSGSGDDPVIATEIQPIVAIQPQPEAVTDRLFSVYSTTNYDYHQLIEQITQSTFNRTMKPFCSSHSQLYTGSILTILFLLSIPVFADDFQTALVSAALERTQHSVRYDGSYYSIPYPDGDVPSNIGVCTDVVIRSYRALDLDLQRLVHEDIAKHFSEYPSQRIWGLSRPDPNIDHRRVPILQTFFRRHGITLPVTQNAADYQAGDLVTWMLPGNLPHIGIVSDQLDQDRGTPLIVHNIGAGPVVENILFHYQITGHYRYWPEP